MEKFEVDLGKLTIEDLDNIDDLIERIYVMWVKIPRSWLAKNLLLDTAAALTFSLNKARVQIAVQQDRLDEQDKDIQNRR